jgi:transposase
LQERDHALLIRRLITAPKVSDLFGQAGRAWLGELVLPLEERESLDASMRQIEFLDREPGDVERPIALDALGWPEVKRLMSVPAVNVICATSFLAAIGDIGRFKNPRKLVGYLGLDPKVRQSGPGPAASGHISKQGSASARWALVEASWSTVRQPGPMRAFYQRVRSRRGHQIAVVAAARELACLLWCLLWCLLTREQDYAYAQLSLTKKKLRRLEIAAGAPKYQGRSNIWSTNDAMRQAERALAEQAEHAYPNAVRDWQASQTVKPGESPPNRWRWARVRQRGAHLTGPQRAKPRGRPQAPDVCASLRQSLTPNQHQPTTAHAPQPHLTFARRAKPQRGPLDRRLVRLRVPAETAAGRFIGWDAGLSWSAVPA